MKKYQYPEAEQKRLESMMIPFAIYQIVDKRVVTLVVSEGARRLFAFDDLKQAYYTLDNDMYKNTFPDDAARIADAAYRFATEDKEFDVIYRTKDYAGNGYRMIHSIGEHFTAETGERLAVVWYTDEGLYDEDNISTDKLFNRTLANAIYEDSFIKAAYYDHLTGLPSMTYFFEIAPEKRNAVIAAQKQPAIMYMDFGGMKYYNHKYGFSQGDKLLQGFARLIAARFGNENCCRLGQDHFVVLTEAENAEQSLGELFEQTRELNSGITLPLHVGIYLGWVEGIAASMACDMAKIACDVIKSDMSSGFRYYSPKMKADEEKMQYIIANLDTAIREGWITVYYQPIVRAVNGRVCSEEALARWIDPVKGFLSPADFVPVLEEHNLIYKLDLHIVDCVLKKIKILQGAGLHIMPQSINLSRSDFDTCDIVEEIRRRVDASGLSRSVLTIEITESIMGKDFEFIKTQIDRFRELGFAVWMDDFGSGYSSLDVLKDINFDLIKFDMRFVQQLDEGNRGRVILSEMLKMAASLGLETVCEGVETEQQATFLRETGCTKLQGYYFEKPLPVEKVLEKYEQGRQIGFENPDEQEYYEALGRVNLQDLSVIAQENPGDFSNYFSMLPMAVIEVNNGLVRFARSNQSYRDFMFRSFGLHISDKPEPFYNRADAMASPFMKMLMKSRDDDGILFLDEGMPNGDMVHSCMRRIAVNSVNGIYATAVAVLSIKSNDYATVFVNIAKAFAADYLNLYYVDLQSERFYEYSTKQGEEDAELKRSDDQFFAKVREDAYKVLYPEDVEAFLGRFTKQNVLSALDESGMFTTSYRLMVGGEAVPVKMKTLRMLGDANHIIIGVARDDTKI